LTTFFLNTLRCLIYMSLSPIYEEWIEKTTLEKKINRCKELCIEMNDIFPELRLCSGFVTLAARPKLLEDHWWLTTPDGEIVDPTANQWLCPIIDYIDTEEEDFEPTGRCQGNGCNKLCYDDDEYCSRECDYHSETDGVF